MFALKSAFAALIVLVAPAAAAGEDEARLAVVLSYADWCASCRVMDRKVAEIRSRRSFEGVRFMTLDYTNRDRETYFAQADAVDLGGAVRAHFGPRVRTGMLLLIDLDEGDVVGEIRRDATPADITYEIWRAEAQARAS